MALKISRKLRHTLFCIAFLIMGTFVIESDILTGHHCAEHLHQAGVHYFEEPEEDKEENDDAIQ